MCRAARARNERFSHTDRLVVERWCEPRHLETVLCGVLARRN
jgi:hypothetical protein